ncbi:MAG: hypothetical protein OCD76_09280 [Reichenbachiella sp.]
MKRFDKMITILFLIALAISCSNNSDSNKVEFNLSDDLFALKNITNSQSLNNIFYTENRLFYDSSKKIEFTVLDSIAKQKILAPIMKIDLGVDVEYTQSFMKSYFISIQNPIGKFKPIVIWTSGDDYTSLILTLIDSTCTPVSHVLLSGGVFTGPYEINDSLTSWGG